MIPRLPSADQVTMSEISYPADVTIPSDLEEARRLQESIERQLHTVTKFTEMEIFSIKLALEEAIVNAIKHGNQMDRGKVVRVAYRVLPHRFDVLVADQGPGFDPEDVPDPTAPENLERPCGRGLLLMRHYMNEIQYLNNGNTVVMSKSAKNGTP
ncbi:MAG: ATP-binding protein [Gemmataceae bacterium]